MNEGNDLKLSTKQNEKFFKERILDDIKDEYDLSTSSTPKAYFTGGLPGAGKSKIVESWKQSNSTILLIDVDELRKLHPNLEKIIEKHGSKTSGITHDDASKWGMQLRNYALEHKIPYILDSTLRNPKSAEVEIKKAQSEDFRTHVTMVAVNEYQSIHGAYDRYLEQYKRIGLEARYVNPLLIRDSSQSIIDSVAVIDKLNVDEFKIVNRQKDILYDNTYSLDTAEEVMRKVTSLENFSEKELSTLENSFTKLSNDLSLYKTPQHIQHEVHGIANDLKKEIRKIKSKNEKDIWNEVERDADEARENLEREKKKEEPIQEKEDLERDIRRNR
jgi:predicted kinase